jgi:hypothetical protein
VRAAGTNRAARPTIPFTAAASNCVSTTPSHSISTKPVINAPVVAPNVFAAYNVPTAGASEPRAARQALTAGSVAPMSVAGTSRITVAIAKRATLKT